MTVRNTLLKSSYSGTQIEAGCDEAGRGCLAGPVFAAAVILPPDYKHNQLNDSKQLSEKLRYRLRKDIEKEALCCAVDYILPPEIDRINILKASILAMHKALDKLSLLPELLLIDGNKFLKYKHLPHKCIIKGDSMFLSIAAASIIAKTHRDDYMNEIHHEYNWYSWDRNKGYATAEHRRAIERYGISPHHRKSFKLLDSQLSIDFS